MLITSFGDRPEDIRRSGNKRALSARLMNWRDWVPARDAKRFSRMRSLAKRPAATILFPLLSFVLI
jgi:hypothetical protein